MDGRSDQPRISASERDPVRRDQPGTQGRPLVVEYRCSTLLRDNDLGQPVGSHGGRRHASIGGCLNSAFLYLNETAPRDQLRPQLSGLWIPNLARGIDSGPRQFTNTKRWIGAPDFTSEWAGTGLTSLKRKRRAFENAYYSMPFACASGLLQATCPASFAFSRAIDPAL